MVRALVIASLYGHGGQYSNNGAAVAMQVIEFATTNQLKDFKDRCKTEHTTTEVIEIDGASND